VPDVGADFDAKAFAKTMKRANVNSVTVFAKCHHGHLYYNTRRPERHPGLKKNLDLLGKQVEALNQADGSTASQAALIVKQDKPFNHETVSFTLAPRGSIEYKYRLDKGESLLYSWTSTAPVNYEFHAEPDGAPRGYAQSYEKSAGGGQNGTLNAPFNGIHGWYWENTSAQPVTVTLSSAGFYNLSHEFTSDGVKNKSFP
jgi:hypothetical protein